MKKLQLTRKPKKTLQLIRKNTAGKKKKGSKYA